jgi:uncharacterized protein YlxP (DUF503 family)
MPRPNASTSHMVIGAGILVFRLHDCHSLKSKRSVIKAMISRIRNHFNASVAEVGANDIYQRAEIGITMAGSDHASINAKMDKMLNFAEALGLAEMVDSEIEIIHL